MAHQNHRGWITKPNEGILAAVYNGAMTGATLLAANTNLEGVLLGTPVTPALAVDTMVISNLVANGDILVAANNGGNSQAWLWVDSSAGTMALYAAGVEQLRTALGAFVINEGSADVDFRVETDGIQYAIYSDGGKNALVLGSNTDTSSADQLITISRAARTATTTVNYFDLAIAPAGAVTIPAGTTAVAASMSIAEPNLTATGTITNAATLYIASQPTEGGTTNSAIRFGAAANISGTTSITINEDSEDIDFRIESNGNANMFVIDAGLDAMGIGGAAVTAQTVTITNAAVAATGRVLKLSGTIAAGALTDGYGAFEVDITMSGSPTNHCAAASAWINITGGTVPAGTYICARNDGIYEDAAATITNAKLIFGARMQYLCTDTDSLRFPWSINTNNAAITALIDVNNISDLGVVANAGATTATLLPILRNAAGTLKYVLLYDLA
ncbi:MAG: hypothetical protein Q7O66_17470 [Dehalococcoidia bacterium]|nr:hypothetical protein [Dehalococcoidia bacterium]